MTLLLTCPSRVSNSPDVLDAIRDPDCNLAIWERAPFADFAPLTGGEPVDIRFETTPDDLPARLMAALVANGFAAPELFEALIIDAALLARRFCAAMDLSQIELRLEVVRTDSCRKFHADYVSARLITTYVGAGTDWLDDSEVSRIAAGGGEPERFNRMAAFDVGLFKGKLATERPAIHRSPPIAGTGAARLLLVLNPVQKQGVDRPNSPFSRGGQVA
jgi:hypothetical protein